MRIVELIKASEQFSEFRLKVGDIEVELRRHGTSGAQARQRKISSSQGRRELSPLNEIRRLAQAVSTEPTPRVAAIPAEEAIPSGSIVIRAPMVGTFYRAPQPGAPPFVQVGDAVEPDTVVCIIEVMKLMNSIPAAAHGTVARILVEDASPVETDRPLIVLAPS